MSISIKLSPSEAARLAVYFKEMGFKLGRAGPYETLRVNEDNLMIVLYSSNMLVYKDNRNTRRIIESILEPKDEKMLYIGSDEAGKGEWYGPLVVAGTCLSIPEITEWRIEGVKDSKSLSYERLSQLAQKMMKRILWKSLVILPERYNQLYDRFFREGKNSNDILAWAHSIVIKDLITKSGNGYIEVIVDKFDQRKTDSRLTTAFKKIPIDEQKVKVIQKYHGEAEIPVAAASIIAKATFEREVKALSKKYNVQLGSVSPTDVPRDLLRKVAKVNFSNVRCLLY